MKYQIIEVTNGVEHVFATLSTSKFRSLEKIQEIVDNRNRMWGQGACSYYLREAA